jgi:hypothetical protein
MDVRQIPGTLLTPLDHLRRDVNAMHVAAHRCHVLQNSTDSAADSELSPRSGAQGSPLEVTIAT